MTTKILKAFYHRTRRQFVPLLAREVAAKIGADEDAATTYLRGLANQGYARAEKDNMRRGLNIWHLTPAGKAQAEQIIRAEALARSV